MRWAYQSEQNENINKRNRKYNAKPLPDGIKQEDLPKFVCYYKEILNIETKGFYYCLYENCEKKLIINFENKYGKVLLYISGVGKYDKENKLLQEFTCKERCRENCGISDRTLKKVLENKLLYNDFYYKYLESKKIFF